MNKGLSPSRRDVEPGHDRRRSGPAAILVMVLVAGIIGMVLVRGIPHISWKFLSTTASVLKRPTASCLPSSTHCMSLLP